MHRSRVGPMAQPNKDRNMWVNGRSGMSMEDLKHQTALRLANEQREDHSAPSEELNDRQPSMAHPSQPFGSPAAYNSFRSPVSPGGPGHRAQQPQQAQYGNYRYDANRFDNLQQQQQQQYESRNYTDSQLGHPAAGSVGSQPLFSSPTLPTAASAAGRSNNNYSTPRSRHHAPLSDRGSAENRSLDGSGSFEALSTASGCAAGFNAKVASPMKGRVGSNSSLKSNGSKQMKGKGRDGRVTPVRDQMEPNRNLYSTPNTRRDISTSTPTSVYSEPQRTKPSTTSRSPRPGTSTMLRSPDYKSRTAQFYKQQQQSKLPHGLTVQELKEMTRARLAAEANYEVDSVHSGSEGQGRNSPGEYPLPPHLPGQQQQTTGNFVPFRKSSADGISVSSSNGNLNGYQQPPPPPPPALQGHPQQQHHQRMQQPPPHGPPMQYPYPRHPSPVYPQQVPNNSSPIRASPSFGKPRTDTWETASVASTLASEYQVPEPYQHSSIGVPSFSSPTSMTFNRGRCFSAGATTTASAPARAPLASSYEASSWEEARPTRQEMRPSNLGGMYYEPALTEEANRRRCATMSPPGMSRLHEDRPFLFSGDEKNRLAIPPLSEPRPRFHTTGILGSAFEPISSFGKSSGMHSQQHGVAPPSPPSLMERVKFNAEDRMLSIGSNGDLPSSVAEAVLESLTASSGPMNLFDSGSPFRSSTNVGLGKSPFRKMASDELYPVDRNRTESTASASMFSSGASKTIFSSEYSNDRLLSMTNSWGGELGEETSSAFGFSHDFSNLLNFNDGPAPRSRAQTAPCFGENHQFLSQLDPEHHFEDKPLYESAPSISGFGRSTNFPPGFDKPGGL